MLRGTLLRLPCSAAESLVFLPRLGLDLSMGAPCSLCSAKCESEGMAVPGALPPLPRRCIGAVTPRSLKRCCFARTGLQAAGRCSCYKMEMSIMARTYHASHALLA
jgi:hypothetical protein